MKKEEDENAAEVPDSAQTAGIRLPGEVKTCCYEEADVTCAGTHVIPPKGQQHVGEVSLPD